MIIGLTDLDNRNVYMYFNVEGEYSSTPVQQRTSLLPIKKTRKKEKAAM